MPFLSKPTRRIRAARRPSGKSPAKPSPKATKKHSQEPKKPASQSPPAKARPAKARKPPPRSVPTGASAYVFEARHELGAILGDPRWTQAELARTIGVKYWTVVDWERGRKAPTQGELDVIARILELARRGVDPRQIAAPDLETLLEAPGPVKRRKLRSILRPEGVEPPTRLFRPTGPRKGSSGSDDPTP